MSANRFVVRAIVAALLGAGSIAAGAKPVATQAAKEEVTQVVERLQKHYDETADFTADFRQTVEVETLGRAIESHGKLWFKRPGRMRWDFETPEEQTIVADGKTLWVYQPEHSQVLKAPFHEAFQSAMPISFLFGMGRLADDFRPTLVEKGKDSFRLRLEPKDSTDIGALLLTVDASTYDVVAAEVTDPLGNVTRLSFSRLVRDAGIDDDKFVFEVPDGVDIVEPPAGQ